MQVPECPLVPLDEQIIRSQDIVEIFYTSMKKSTVSDNLGSIRISLNFLPGW